MSRQGIVYIGERDAGKTTKLYHAYEEALKKKKRILILDSATDHEDRSLIRKIQRENQGILIESCNEFEIVFPKITPCSYPYELVKDKDSSLFLCDAAYFLEKGYDYPEGTLREKQRKLYKYFSMQVICVLMDRVDTILMDEIELLPEFREIITMVSQNNIQLVMTLHKTAGLSGMDDLIRIERI